MLIIYMKQHSNLFWNSTRIIASPNETEFLWSATARRQSQLDTTPIDLGDRIIRSSNLVCDLGFIIDSRLNFIQHVYNINCIC